MMQIISAKKMKGTKTMKRLLPYAAAFLLLAVSILGLLFASSDGSKSSDSFDEAVLVSIFEGERPEI